MKKRIGQLEGDVDGSQKFQTLSGKSFEVEKQSGGSGVPPLVSWIKRQDAASTFTSDLKNILYELNEVLAA
jgi:hypothetical protein